MRLHTKTVAIIFASLLTLIFSAVFAPAAAEPYNYVTNGTFADYYYNGTAKSLALLQHGYISQNASGTYNQATTPNTYVAGWTYVATNGGIGYNGHTLTGTTNPLTFTGDVELPTDPVIFVQNKGVLSTTLEDLVVGEKYILSYQYSSRAGTGRGGDLQSYLLADGAKTILQPNQFVAYNAGGFFDFVYEFEATAAKMEFGFETGYSGADRTTTFTNVSVVKSSEAETGFRGLTAWKNDATSGIVEGGQYTHAYNVAWTGAQVELNGVTFQNLATNGSTGGLTWNNTGGTYNGNQPTPVYDADSVASANILNGFRTDGANFTLNGLLPGYEYELVIMSSSYSYNNRSAWTSVNDSEPLLFNAHAAVGASPATENNNFDGFLTREGMILTWQGTANENGQLVVKSDTLGASWHVYGIANRITSAPADVLMATTFTGLNTGTNITGTTMDHVNRLSPADNNTWQPRGSAGGSCSVVWNADANVSYVQLGVNTGRVMALDPDAFDGVTDIRVSIDLCVNDLTFESYTNVRGVGLGFYSNDAVNNWATNGEVSWGFTGLVVSPTGELYFSSKPVRGQTEIRPPEGTDPSKYKMAYGGAFDAKEFYNLSFDLHLNDDGTAALIDIIFGDETNTADYGDLIDAVNDSIGSMDISDYVSYIGFMSSSSSGGKTSFVDNFMVYDISPSNNAVPEPATWVLMLLAAGGMAVAYRRKR